MLSHIRNYLHCLLSKNNDPAHDLYWQIVTLSRNPRLYQEYHVPDTLDGRFDCLLCHVFLVVEALQNQNEMDLADQILNLFIKDMDRSLRESGVGDPSISRKMRKIGEAYMGRMAAYKEAIDDFEALKKVIEKNVYRNQKTSPTAITLLTDYMVNYRQVLNRFAPRKPLPQAVFDRTGDNL